MVFLSLVSLCAIIISSFILSSTQKKNAVLAAEKHLLGLAEWSEPKGGMFLWIKVPGLTDTKSMIEEKALAKEVSFDIGSTSFLLRG